MSRVKAIFWISTTHSRPPPKPHSSCSSFHNFQRNWQNSSIKFYFTSTRKSASSSFFCGVPIAFFRKAVSPIAVPAPGTSLKLLYISYLLKKNYKSGEIRVVQSETCDGIHSKHFARFQPFSLEILFTSCAVMSAFPSSYPLARGTPWRSWLRHCATSRNVVGSIPNVVIGIFQ